MSNKSVALSVWVGERLSLREDQVDSGPGSPGGEEEREYKAWKKSIIMVLGHVGERGRYTYLVYL